MMNEDTQDTPTMRWDLLAPAIKGISLLTRTPKGTAIADRNAAQVRDAFEEYGLPTHDGQTLFTACAVVDMLGQAALNDYVDRRLDAPSYRSIVGHLRAFLSGLVPYLPEEVRHG